MARAPVMEKSFPRGGKKPKKSHAIVDFGVFKSKKSTPVKKKHNKGHVKKPTVPGTSFKTTVVRDLTVNEIRPGMILYGCVDTITEVDVQFSIPGSCRAVVPAGNISTQYRNLINEDNSELPLLSELFKLGEFFPLVIAERYGEHSRKFKASLEPSEINCKLSTRFLQIGLALTGAIASEEEHGFVVDLGLPRVAAFLRHDNVSPDLNLLRGQLVQVFVASLSEDHYRVQLTMTAPDLFVIDEQFPVNCFLPGLQAKLMVSQVLKGGVEVWVKGLGPDIKGFIHNSHLPKIFDKGLNYPEGTELNGTLLYVLPIVNFPFFKATHQKQPAWKLSYGNLIENAKVMTVSDAGLTVKIRKDGVVEKCFIPVHRLDQRNKAIDGKVKLNEIYQKGAILRLIRIERPSRLGRFYFAAMDRESLNEAFYSKNDLKVGQKVKCTLAVVGQHYCTVELSKHVKGFVPAVHVTEMPGVDFSSKFKVGQAVKGRVLSLGEDGKNARITLKPSLLKAKMLTSDTEVKIGDKYPGTVCKIFHQKILVEFFGGRVGEVSKENMTLSHHGSSIPDSFKIGQVVNCYIISSEKHKLALSLICNKDIAELVTIGKKYPAIVTVVADEGVYVDVQLKNKEIHPGFIPNRFISSYEGIWTQKKKLCKKGDKLPAVCVYCDSLRNPPILLAVHPSVVGFIKGKKQLTMELGAVFPCVNIPGSKITVPAVPIDSRFEFDVRGDNLTDYQVISAKIEKIDASKVICSTKLSAVWDRHYMSSFANLKNYLTEIDEIREELRRNKQPIADMVLGQSIFAKTDGTELKLKNGIVAKCSVQAGSKISGRVVWIDLCREIVWIHPHPQTGPVDVKLETREFIHAKIVHVCVDCVVALAAGSHELVFIPTRRHANDGISHEKAYSVGESVKLRVDRLGERLFGIDRTIAKRKDCPSLKNGPVAKRAKVDDDISVAFEKKGVKNWVDPIKLELMSDEEEEEDVGPNVENVDVSEIKSEVDSEDDPPVVAVPLENHSSDDDVDEVKNEPADVMDVSFDWSVAENPLLLQGALNGRNDEESSSDDEGAEDKTEKKKKKRLTGAEKREKAMESEERLRDREMQLVDPTRPPQSADDFDRLVMSSPDNSAIWLQYMAHHLQDTEIEKARAVARRALKSMSFREEQEKMNIWFALLNLEQLYGDADSQKSVLDEALRCNEPYKVHLHKLNMLADNSAGLEAEKLANVMLKKYGESEDVWPDVGGALMKIGKIDFARSVLKRGMAALPNAKHVGLITKFAKLESKFGSGERAQTLYEHVLSSFPKRVDVWSAYVDLMVKSGQIELARQILERGTSQSLPLKKMKILYKKFIAFEETHGTAENVEKVRQAAAEFLEGISEEK